MASDDRWRRYDHDRDFAAVTRIWREVGWIGKEDHEVAALGEFFSVGDAVVAPGDGDAECAVHRTAGSMCHLDTDLSLSAVTAVTTSRVGRRQGHASTLMAETLAGAHDDGAAVAVLGMFEQGFYDRFGFGTGSYEHRLAFDPGDLTVPMPDRAPVRVGLDDAAEVHALLHRRHRGHGSVVLDPVGIIRAELGWQEHGFGLGFRDDDGRLTHFLYGSAKGENGPYRISWMGYETPQGLLELLGLLRSLGDQVHTVVLGSEPPEIQLQDVVRHPIRLRTGVRADDRLLPSHTALAYDQLRILDLPACIGAVRTRAPALRCGLRLRDPVADRGGRWSGLAGEWTLDLGASSSATRGLTDGLPVLDAGVGAFSRLWVGVRPATSLALTDDLAGPDGLLAALDEVFRLPTPRPGWNY